MKKEERGGPKGEQKAIERGIYSSLRCISAPGKKSKKRPLPGREIEARRGTEEEKKSFQGSEVKEKEEQSLDVADE